MPHYWKENSSEEWQRSICNDLAVRLDTQLTQIEEATGRAPDAEDVGLAWKQVCADMQAIGADYPPEFFAFRGFSAVSSIIENFRSPYAEAVLDYTGQAYDL